MYTEVFLVCVCARRWAARWEVLDEFDDTRASLNLNTCLSPRSDLVAEIHEITQNTIKNIYVGLVFRKESCFRMQDGLQF